MLKKTQEEFISEIKEIHGDKYDLIKTIYNCLNYFDNDIAEIIKENL